MKAIVDEALAESPSVEHVVVWRRLGDDVPMQAGATSSGTRRSPTARASWSRSRSTPSTRTSSPTPPARPGRRRASLHVQGGFLVSITREVAYQADARPGDVIHFVTDMGWIMGPWTVVGGRRARLHDRLRRGRARLAAPTGSGGWSRASGSRSSASRRRSMRALIPHGAELVERHDLSSLRVLVTTGEPWNPEPYRWLFEHVGGGRCPIINCSGGTEVGACFLSPTPAAPIKACSLGGPALGMAMDVVDAEGRSVSRRGRRARLPPAVPGNDPRLLARPRALPGHLLAPAAGRLGARRLGLGGRGRLLVPARPLGRHAQHRRQADRPGRARVGGRRAPVGRGGGGGRRAARGEGRGGVGLLRPRAGRRAERRAGR